MSENNKTEEFLQKLSPCIEGGELEECVEEAAREMEAKIISFIVLEGNKVHLSNEYTFIAYVHR